MSAIVDWVVGIVVRVLVPFRLMFGSLFKTSKSEPSGMKGGWSLRGPSEPLDPRVLVDKLRKYRDLAEDALEQAYEADVSGDFRKAASRYKIGLQAIEEGLKLNAPESGLGAQYDNSARWKKELNTWQNLALDRLRDLDSPRATTSGPEQPATRITRQSSLSSNRVLQSYNRNPKTHPTAPSAKSTDKTKVDKGDAALRGIILAEVLDKRPSVRWNDIAGLSKAKQALQEMVILPALRADLFKGLRTPARGLLLYGPPGNGKTLLARALAHESKATFFNISATTLTSKWHGEAERLVRLLFAIAAELQPAIIFIDEIDSILSERSSGEHEASRRLKTQFLVEFDGVTQASERVVVIGATNRPQELDEAVRRRLVKRIYVPMPDALSRVQLLKNTLQDQPCKLSKTDLKELVDATEGYSGSDLAALCRDAAMQPIRELGMKVSTVPADKLRPINVDDFHIALQSIRPSVSNQQLNSFAEWTKNYGTQA